MAKEQEIYDRVNQIVKQYGLRFVNTFPLSKKQAADKTSRLRLINDIGAFLLGLVTVNLNVIPQISQQDIVAAVKYTDEGLPADAVSDIVFKAIVSDGQLFLSDLADQGVLSMTKKQVNQAFQLAALGRVQKSKEATMPFVTFESSVANNENDPDVEDYHYEDPKLPKLNWETASQIKVRAGYLAQEFVYGKALKRIIGAVSTEVKNSMALNLTKFAEHMYGEYRRTPSQWSQKALKGIMTGYFVKDAFIFPDEYPQVADILKGYMDYCAQNKFVAGRIADLMKRGVDKYALEMVQLGADKANYSKRKRAGLAALEEKHAHRKSK